MQSEFYLGDAVNGVRPFDYNKMLATNLISWHSTVGPNQYIDTPIRVKVEIGCVSGW